jgi:cytochrome c biogenesis protein
VKARSTVWQHFIETFWRFFISLKLTFILLAFIGIGAVLGMSFDQTQGFDEFIKEHNAIGIKNSLLNFFEIYDAFHSWWFSLSILLLSANLIACSIERLPRLYFEWIKPRPFLTDRRLLGLSLKANTTLPSLIEAQRLVENFFAKKPQLIGQIGNRSYFYMEKQGLARFGVYVVHIALLIVMYSSIYATHNGVDAHVMIEEGSKTRFISAKGPGGVRYNYDLGFYIGCNDFRLRTFVDNSPMEFESDLYIESKPKNELVSKTVRVNEPLSYAGFTFYQASFRPLDSEKEVIIAIENQGQTLKHRVHLGEEIKYATFSLVPEKIYDDFAGLGPALRVAKNDASGPSTFFHIFRQYPDYDRVVRADSFNAVFLESDQRYATGLSVGYVPGKSIIFSGFLLLLVGLFMCFFMTPLRYFARIDCQDQAMVYLALQGSRHPNLVRQIFEQKMRGLSIAHE